MSLITSRTMRGISTYVVVVISPAMWICPVIANVSHATRPCGSSLRIASRTASEIWSATLSGWPSVTDSEVNRRRYAISLGSFAPRRHVLHLLRRRRVDRNAERGELELRDFLVDVLGDRVDLLLERLVVLREVRGRHRLVGERHVHHGGGVAFAGGEVDE